jgi:GNAT superfamily N-acetyltransferase
MNTELKRKAPGEFRKLGAGDGSALQAHLLRLDAESRRMRFGTPVTDYFVQNYAQNALGSHSIIFGYFVDGILRGAGELRGFRSVGGSEAEAAFSVEREFQNGGVGTELFGRVVLAARNRNIGKLFVNCLAHNQRMQAIAKKFDAVLTFDSDEVTGRIETPRATALSIWREALKDGSDFAGRLIDAQAKLLRPV